MTSEVGVRLHSMYIVLQNMLYVVSAVPKVRIKKANGITLRPNYYWMQQEKRDDVFLFSRGTHGSPMTLPFF